MTLKQLEALLAQARAAGAGGDTQIRLVVDTERYTGYGKEACLKWSPVAAVATSAGIQEECGTTDGEDAEDVPENCLFLYADEHRYEELPFYAAEAAKQPVR